EEWRVTLAESSDRIAEGVEREEDCSTCGGAVEHSFHVLQRQRPADAVEQLIEHALPAGLRRQRGGKVEIAAIAGQLAREDRVKWNADFVVAWIDARDIRMSLYDVACRGDLEAEFYGMRFAEFGDRLH